VYHLSCSWLRLTFFFFDKGCWVFPFHIGASTFHHQ
jgi:hypothetical protein